MAVGVESALEFLKKIKGVYGADSSQYQGFIDALKDFKGGRANVSETTKGVIALFQGHPELIEEYATYLPPGNTIQIPIDIQGNILVTTTTGTMEVARDGTVVNETHIQAPEDQPVERSSELAESDKHFLENLQARIADSEEHKAKYEVFKASWEAYLKMSPEQRTSSLGAGQAHEFMEQFKDLLGDDDEFRKLLSEVSA